MAKYQTLVNGFRTLVKAITASTGAADADKMIATDSTGKIDLTFMPVGIGPDIKVLEASEDLAAGDYVNIHEDTGVFYARLADNSSNRAAHGFVKEAALTGVAATIYFEGPNTDVIAGTGRTYLGLAGKSTVTPLDATDVANDGKYHQYLGIHVDTNEVNADIDDVVIL